jgi:hypothetical protein
MIFSSRYTTATPAAMVIQFMAAAGARLRAVATGGA